MTAPRVLALVLALMTLLGGCASHASRHSPPAARRDSATTGGARLPSDTSRPQAERYRQSDDNGPGGPPPDVSKIPEPVPKVEPRARYGNKPVYSVLGKSYSLLPDASGYVERGIASWYGNKFHGYMTSSFEPYDMYAFSAAHKTLPLPSYARVTNLENGKSVVVRINDRGPFHENRIIDLSYVAAVKIGVWPKGTGLVEVRGIDPEHPQPALPPTRYAAAAPAESAARTPRAPSSAPAPPRSAAALLLTPLPAPLGATPRIYLQLGAFGDRANADRVAANAKRAGLDQVAIQSVGIAGHDVHRVRVGPLADVDAADALTARIERLGLGTPRVAIDR